MKRAQLFVIPIAASLMGMLTVIAFNRDILAVGSAHYRAVATQAEASGVLTQSWALLLDSHRNNITPRADDSIFLLMLSLPREAVIENAISPLAFVGDIDQQGRAGAPFNSPFGPYYGSLEHNLPLLNANQPISTAYYHRYIHGDMTVAGILLGVLSYTDAVELLWLIIFSLVSFIIVSGYWQLHRHLYTPQRGASFLIIGVVFMLFYGLPNFDQSFYFAPTDITIMVFILICMWWPICKLPEYRFVWRVAMFATFIAILEFAAIGTPLGLAVLITMIALGEAEDGKELFRRQIIGISVYIGTIVLCGLYKLALIALVFGQHEIVSFMEQFFYRVNGTFTPNTMSPQYAGRIQHLFHLPLSVIDSSRFLRFCLMLVSLVYSSFIIGWGSQVLGAIITIIPTPIVIIGSYLMMRKKEMSEYSKNFFLSLLGAALVCPVWYVIFIPLVIRHSYFMVRPLAFTVALCGIFLVSSRRISGISKALLWQARTEGA